MVTQDDLPELQRLAIRALHAGGLPWPEGRGFPGIVDVDEGTYRLQIRGQMGDDDFVAEFAEFLDSPDDLRVVADQSADQSPEEFIMDYAQLLRDALPDEDAEEYNLANVASVLDVEPPAEVEDVEGMDFTPLHVDSTDQYPTDRVAEMLDIPPITSRADVVRALDLTSMEKNVDGVRRELTAEEALEEAKSHSYSEAYTGRFVNSPASVEEGVTLKRMRDEFDMCALSETEFAQVMRLPWSDENRARLMQYLSLIHI